MPNSGIGIMRLPSLGKGIYSKKLTQGREALSFSITERRERHSIPYIEKPLLPQIPSLKLPVGVDFECKSVISCPGIEFLD